VTEANSIFAEYLYHSYLYYKLHMPLLSDNKYDTMCKYLISNWDKVTHRFKSLVTIDDLNAGTGYAIQYPAGMERVFLKHHTQGVLYITESNLYSEKGE